MRDRNRYALRRPPDEATTYREVAEEHERTQAKTLGLAHATEVPAGAPTYPTQDPDGPWGVSSNIDRGPGEPFGEDLSRAEWDGPTPPEEPPMNQTQSRPDLEDLINQFTNSEFDAEEGVRIIFTVLAGVAGLSKELRTLAGIRAETKKAQAELDAVKAKLASVANFKESLQ